MFAKLAWTAGLLAVGITCVSVTSLSAQAPQTAQPKEQQKIFFRPDERRLTGIGWSITTTSGEAEIALARHLVNIGAKEYAAW
ncbi:hypothetical protein [Nostoc sp. MG11]|uniref:hypothetical protein n=1 Tax=Nostoc sp. MG11 TaxID=2721166 RepID=UPI0018670C4A